MFRKHKLCARTQQTSTEISPQLRKVIGNIRKFYNKYIQLDDELAEAN